MNSENLVIIQFVCHAAGCFLGVHPSCEKSLSHSFSKFGVKTPLPMRCAISSCEKKRPPSSSVVDGWRGVS